MLHVIVILLCLCLVLSRVKLYIVPCNVQLNTITCVTVQHLGEKGDILKDLCICGDVDKLFSRFSNSCFGYGCWQSVISLGRVAAVTLPPPPPYIYRYMHIIF